MDTILAKPAPPFPNPKRTRYRRNPRTEIIAIQRQLLEDIASPDTTPTERSSCARAFEVLEERLRILKGKPLPGQLRPDLEQRHASRRKGRSVPLSTYTDAIPITAEPAVKQIQQSSGAAEPAISGEPKESTAKG